MKVSVVVPCHNEEKNIEPLVSRILKAFGSKQIDGEICIVDDHSTDGTAAEVERLMKSDSRVRLVRRNDGLRGVGRTLRAGFEHATGEVIVTMDGDLSHTPEDIPRFLDEIEKGADLVIGSRHVSGGRASMPRLRIFISGSYNKLASLLFCAHVYDMTTGYRAIKKSALSRLRLRANHFEIHPEIHLEAINRGLKVVEIPISYEPRQHGTSKLRYFKVAVPYGRVLFRELWRRYFG
ncbi:MAG: glycosyltransferase [Chloroflexi bacterium]|nr:glycosyltransferase [Chloroflexota bacterium]